MSALNMGAVPSAAPQSQSAGVVPCEGVDDPSYLSAMKNYSLMGQAMTTMEDIMLLFTELANSKFEQMSKKTEISRDAQDKANSVERALASLSGPDDKGELSPEVIQYMRENNILVEGKTIDEFIGTQSESARYIARLTDLVNGVGSEGMECASWLDILDYMDEQGMTVDGLEPRDFVWNLPEVGQQNGQKILPENMQKILSVLEGDGVQLDKGDLMAVKSALESTSGRASDFVQQNQLKLQQLMQSFNTAVTMANSIQSMNAESTKSIAQAVR